MTKPPAVPLYTQDLLVSTAEMTHEEVGAFIRQLCYQWVNGSILNRDGSIKDEFVEAPES